MLAIFDKLEESVTLGYQLLLRHVMVGYLDHHFVDFFADHFAVTVKTLLLYVIINGCLVKIKLGHVLQLAYLLSRLVVYSL